MPLHDADTAATTPPGHRPERQRIAVVGTGIAGMSCAWLLSQRHEVTVFESEPRPGGHSHTVGAPCGGATVPVDTGFIVYNERTYPHFTRLLRRLEVASQPTRMSFSVSSERTGLEYAGTNLNTLFAQRRNLVNATFLAMLRDILRFNRSARAFLAAPGGEATLGQFLAAHRFGRAFVEHYLLPMTAAIWSAVPARMQEFPARALLGFLDNHRLLSAGRQLPWRTISGGGRRYVEALVAPFRGRVRLNTPVRRIRRDAGGVWVEPAGGRPERFDHVVIACHSDQALALLADPSEREREILGAIPYQRNEAVLHTDAGLLPRSRRAWAAWNYHVPPGAQADAPPQVTYNLNILQGLDAPRPFCVTLNRPGAIDPARVLGRFTYHHPVFTAAGIAAQARRAEISGVGRTHYCGAYWGYGFHEDGVNSALAVCAHFGRRL